jgi:protein ImuB
MPSSNRRILALWLPRLPTDRLARKSPAPFKAPLVVSRKVSNALLVHALDARAARLGLYQGQPLANARAIVQPLIIVPADEKADAALLEAIADWCDRFTPLVTLDPPYGLFLDITGAAHLFGGEALMLAQVTQKIGAQGFTVRAAIAGTSLAARALARFAHSASSSEAVGHKKCAIVPPGDEAGAVAPLPIAAFECDDKILRALRHAGLKTVGAVADRLSSELTERLGRSFVTQLKIMLGAEEKPLQPRRALPDLMAEQRFAEPIVSEDAIAASLLHLAQSLSEILERQGRGVRLLEAVFFRADGKVDRIAVKTGEPLRDAAVMLRLLRQKLDILSDPLDAGFGFDIVRLEAVLAEDIHPATISFDSGENARQQIAFLVDRLSVRFGEHRVQRFIAQDTHIPEAAAVAVPAQDKDFVSQNWTLKRQPGDPPHRPLRLLERPEEISVLASIPDGPPRRFRWRQCVHNIAHLEGPERIALEWWKELPTSRLVPSPNETKEQEDARKKVFRPSRDYFRVESEAGMRFWLFRDAPQTRWYMHGLFA